MQVSDSARLRQQNLQVEINKRLAQPENLAVQEETLIDRPDEVEEIKITPVTELYGATDFNLTAPLVAPLQTENSSAAVHQNQPSGSSDTAKNEAGQTAANAEKKSAVTAAPPNSFVPGLIAGTTTPSPKTAPRRRKYIAVVVGIGIFSLLIVLAAVVIGLRVYSQRELHLIESSAPQSSVSGDLPQPEAASTAPNPNTEPIAADSPSPSTLETPDATQNANQLDNQNPDETPAVTPAPESGKKTADRSDKTDPDDKRPKPAKTAAKDDAPAASPVKTPKPPPVQKPAVPADTKPKLSRKPIQTPTIAP